MSAHGCPWAMQRCCMSHARCWGLKYVWRLLLLASAPNSYAAQLMPLTCSQQPYYVRMPSKADRPDAMAKLTARPGTCNQQPGGRAPLATEPCSQHGQSLENGSAASHDVCICRFAPFNQPPPPPPRARPPSAPIDHTGPRYMAGPPEFPPRPQQPQQMAGPGARGHGQYEGHGQMPSYGAGNMAGAGYMPPHLRNRDRVSLWPCVLSSLLMAVTSQS